MILVTGANGQLGQSIRSKTSSEDVMFFDKSSLDITDIDSVTSVFKYYKPKVIINCAAYTNVDLSETEKRTAEKVNVQGPHNLAVASQRMNSTLIHISTDYVYDGQKSTPWVEDDLANPINFYGRTKLKGEKEIQRISKNYILLRTSWLYSEYKKNFLTTMLKLLSSQQELSVVYDQTGSPTYAGSLASTLLSLARNSDLEKLTGLYNFSNTGATTWYDFSLQIRKIINSNCKVIPILSRDYPTPAQRPHYTVLNNQKFHDTFNLPLTHWVDELEKCIQNISKGRF